MEIIALCILVLFAYFVIKENMRSKSSKDLRSASDNNIEEDTLENNKVWLSERWQRAEGEKESGNFQTVPNWFFDRTTDAQINRLKSHGIVVDREKTTKGQASDMIGLFEPAEDENLEVLRFFKCPLSGMNQSRARHEVAQILADEEKLKQWESRPSNAMQKEYFRFFRVRVPKGLTYGEAREAIKRHQEEIPEEQEKLLDDWFHYKDMFDDLCDFEIRKELGINKVSLALFRQAVGSLSQEGEELSTLDLDTIVDRMLELKPEIEREI